jgi:hypothetical protein
MGFYFSEDGRYCTSTLDTPSSTFLTQQGQKDTNAAITIQRWWRRILNIRLREFQQELTTTSSEDSQGSLEVHGSLRKRFKRKLNDIQSDDEDEETSDTELVDYESSEFSQVDKEEEEEEEEDETQLQTVNDNNFLWDFIMSFLSFFKYLFGF